MLRMVEFSTQMAPSTGPNCLDWLCLPMLHIPGVSRIQLYPFFFEKIVINAKRIVFVGVERQSRTPEEDERQENFSAFLAQLSERNFCSWYDTLSWSGNNLTSILKENNREVKALVRIISMWLIYAPKKVRTDAATGREERRFKFEPENWEEWKKILEESKSRFSDDADTQKLVETALNKMEEAEA